jgi:exonuclease VII small subunit
MDNLKFADVIKELEVIVERLESGYLSPDKALSEYENSIELYV